jgi:uncharacterized Zn-binding protein involved in type VI secretion
MYESMIVDGDTHSHGGQVIASRLIGSTQEKRFVCEGDEAVCYQHGSTRVATATARMVIDGCRVARHGDTLACGAVIQASSTLGSSKS